jgi:hypothetical protein
MRNSFNLLLIALSCFDSCYLFGSILESMRKSFQLDSNLHRLLFPYLLYPGQMIVMSGSVFMTVAIAMERYVAVHYPLDYNQVSCVQRWQAAKSVYSGGRTVGLTLHQYFTH